MCKIIQANDGTVTFDNDDCATLDTLKEEAEQMLADTTTRYDETQRFLVFKEVHKSAVASMQLTSLELARISLRNALSTDDIEDVQKHLGEARASLKQADYIERDSVNLNA